MLRAEYMADRQKREEYERLHHEAKHALITIANFNASQKLDQGILDDQADQVVHRFAEKASL